MKTPLSDRTKRKERYAIRKAAGRCCDCAAKLQEDDGLRCVECTESARASKLRYVHKPSVKKADAARIKRRRADRIARGVCILCPRERAPDSKIHCAQCQADRRTYYADLRARHRAGIIPIAKALKPKRAKERKYRPLEELLAMPRNRILRAIRWMDWTSANELLTAAGFPDHTGEDDYGQNAPRNSAMVMLSRMVREGVVERRGKRNSFDYRLAEAGRPEVQLATSGDIPARRRIKRAA